MKSLPKEFMELAKEPIFYLSFIGGLLINSLIWILLLVRIPAQNNWIALHYNIYFGIDWIGPWVQIFYYPFTGLIILFFNSLINVKVFKANKLLSNILSLQSFLVQIIILTAILTLLIKYYS